ncbi:MAG: hypothetical protein KBS61_09250, partial [Chryseobacterium sp.]|nr:hypothetical protein [Candidatus Chryseobacterium enterohippi]
MKKLALIIAIFSCTLFFAQKSKSYVPVGYSSICCGTPSSKPVMNYIADFQKKNKKSIEVYQQSGLGREGEYSLFLGLDSLTKSKKKKFLSGLQTVIEQQNATKKRGKDGEVAIDVNYS